MRTPDITGRKCTACGNERVKLVRIPKDEIRKLFSQDLLIRDTANQRLCKKCSQNISPAIFHSTREATWVDVKSFVTKEWSSTETKKPPPSTSDDMQDEPQSGKKRHVARKPDGTLQKKPRSEVCFVQKYYITRELLAFSAIQHIFFRVPKMRTFNCANKKLRNMWRRKRMISMYLCHF